MKRKTRDRNRERREKLREERKRFFEPDTWR